MSRKIVFSLIALSIIALGSIAYGSVLGIDLGSEFMKISSISPGKSFVIVENTATRRKTNTAISFYGGDRWFETDAIQKKPRAFANTFVYINKYLGKPYDEQIINAYKETYLDLYNFEKQEDKGTIKFAVSGFKIEEDQSMSFSVEELVSMYLKHAKILADKQAGLKIKDAVITIPPWYGIRERLALSDAVQLAGLTPLAFIHENTAAALYYAIERKDENKTHTVIFYNLGSGSLKVSIAEFKMENSTEKFDKNKKYESFTVLAEAWEEDVNGYLFDLNLARWLAERFDEQPNRKGKSKAIDSPSALAKLLKEANKAKEVLSANKETSIYVEALLDDQDFKHIVKRQVFEDINKAQFELLTAPIQKVLEDSEKTFADVDAIEMLGGALRVPKVQQIVQEFLGKEKELGAHMNGDEAMALGTSFYAASLSSSFKTRPVYMNDGVNFAIYATIRDLEADDSTDNEANSTVPSQTDEIFEKNTTLFFSKQKLGTKKALAFTHDRDIKVILYTKHSNGSEEVFSTYRITKVADYSQNRTENMSSPKVSLTFRLNNLGLVDLIKSDLLIEETRYVEEKIPRIQNKEETETVKNQSTTNTTSDQTGDATNTSESEDSSNENKIEQPVGEPATNETDSENVTDSADNTTEPEKILKKKVYTHSKELTIDRIIPSHLKLSEDYIMKALKGIKKIEDFEEAKKKKSEAKNILESFVYKTQELSGDDDFQLFCTEDELQTLKNLATENDDWLYSDEARTAVLADFEDRYQNMSTLVNRIIYRQDQDGKREDAIKEAYKAIEDVAKKTKNLNVTKSWIKEENTSDVLQAVERAREWLDEKVEAFKGQKKTNDPVVSTTAINARISLVKDAFARVKAIPRPKTEKEKERERAKSRSKTGGKGGDPEDMLFDMFLKYKNISISNSDDSIKNMFRSSMKDEYEIWREEFMQNFTKHMNDKNNAENSDNQTTTNSTDDTEIPQDKTTTTDKEEATNAKQDNDDIEL